MQDFRKLRVWQQAQDLAVRINAMPPRAGGESGGSWRGQLRRSSSSIAANIAEGAMRDTPRQFAHFLEIAIASASETENHLDFALRTRAISGVTATALLSELVIIRRMLVVLRRRVLESTGRDGSRPRLPPETRNPEPETRNPEPETPRTSPDLPAPIRSANRRQ
ncbi:MAG: four helix bundle protein [Gemmatimonas sp.]|uniref:four helix bundle protein n=1 Tax=Gemmatimonas sp. TaxID=1962908 RepID=UPI0031BF47E8|nr:four helix bundle protein [Gemmatimonas sp.]MCA2986486.1 four helix bundle protein [Gemmatimonas sp.]